MFWTYTWGLNKIISGKIVRFAVSHIVALSVALSVCHTSEPCKKRLNRSSYHLRSGLGWTQWTTYYMRSSCQHGKRQFWGGNRQTIVNHRDTPRSFVQRRLNWSRCRLGCGLAWAESITCYTWEVQIPNGKGQFWWIGAPIVKYRHFCRKLCKNG